MVLAVVLSLEFSWASSPNMFIQLDLTGLAVGYMFSQQVPFCQETVAADLKRHCAPVEVEETSYNCSRCAVRLEATVTSQRALRRSKVQPQTAFMIKRHGWLLAGGSHPSCGKYDQASFGVQLMQCAIAVRRRVRTWERVVLQDCHLLAGQKLNKSQQHAAGPKRSRSPASDLGEPARIQ